MVVVDLGDVLAACRSDDASGALDEETVVGDRAGEEEGVEGRGVEASALRNVLQLGHYVGNEGCSTM